VQHPEFEPQYEPKSEGGRGETGHQLELQADEFKSHASLSQLLALRQVNFLFYSWFACKTMMIVFACPNL
jgi:hypothetical protein